MQKIKKMTDKDIIPVAELLMNKYNFASREEAIRILIEEMKYCHFRLAEDNGKVIGIIGWRRQGTLLHGLVELTRIAVSGEIDDPSFIKEMLFDVMVAEADYYFKKRGSKLRKVFSMIHSDNRQIKEFFINKGMEQEAVLRNHFHNGQDELVFSMFFS